MCSQPWDLVVIFVWIALIMNESLRTLEELTIKILIHSRCVWDSAQSKSLPTACQVVLKDRSNMIERGEGKMRNSVSTWPTIAVASNLWSKGFLKIELTHGQWIIPRRSDLSYAYMRKALLR